MEIEVGKLIKKAKVQRCGDGEYPVLSMTMHEGLMFQEDRFKKQIASVDKSKYQIVRRHQLVESFPIDEGVLAVQELTDEAIVSPAYKIWDVDTNAVNPLYLEYALRAPKSIEYYKSKLRGTTARRRSITDEELCAMKINYPSMDRQLEVIKTINTVKNLSARRKQAIECLDKLIKARFVEMFGNPKTNKKGFIKASMGEYITLLTDFSSNGSYKTLDSGVTMYDEPNYAWMVRTTDLESGNMASIKYIDEKAYALLSKSKLYGGEIIMSKIGSAGKVYLMPEPHIPASLGRNAFMFRYDERINVRFLFDLLESEYGQAEIQQYVRGAVTKTITKDDVRSVLIIVPDRHLQDDYVSFAHQVDKSRLVVQKALDETQTLFDSLLQEYFG